MDENRKDDMPESTGLFAPLKVSDGEIEVEYSISVPFSMLPADPQKQGELAKKIRDVDAQIDACTAYVDKLNAEIDRLTNHATGSANRGDGRTRDRT